MLKPVLVDRCFPQDEPTARARRVRSVTVNLAESPLSWLAARGLVSRRQLEAGELLRRDFETARLGQRVTMNWDAPPLGSSRRSDASRGSATMVELSAKARFDAAIAAVGPGLSDIVWRVICAGETIPVAERSLGWPTRAGRLVLTLALDRVADWYRVA